MTLLQKVCALILALAAITGGAIAYDKSKADQCDLDLLSSRLEQKIVEDRLHNIQRRIWALEERYGIGVPNAPPEIKKEYQELKLELQSLEKKGK